MSSVRKQWPLRLAAAVPAAALLVYVLLCTNPHYDLGDDVLLMRSFGGMVGGVYEGFNPFTHTLLARLLQGLSIMMPSVAWFSVAQLVALTAGLYLIALGALRAGMRLGLPAWAGWLAGAAFAAAFVTEPLSSVMFTATTAVLGAAGVWRLMALDPGAQDARLARGMLGSFALLLAAYSLRPVSMAPALGFWLGGAACLWLVRRARLAAVLKGLGLCALAMALMWGVRAVEVRLTGEQDYLRWQQANVNAIDYGGLSAADGDTLNAIGWTQSMKELGLNWCFLDASMSAEAFEAIPPDTSGRSLSGAMDTVRRAMTRSPGMKASMYAVAGLCALAAGLSLLGGRGRRLWPFLASVGCGAGAAALIFYLAWMGRLPARAAMTVLLPANAMALWLALQAAAALWESGRAPRRGLAAAAVLVCAAMLAPCAMAAYRATYNPFGTSGESACTQLERYALANGDELIVTDGNCCDDRALFPDWSAGKPANLLLDWGGWNNHSEGYRAAFARFGYEHDRFRIADFLDSPLRLATSVGAQPPEALVTCIEEQTGASVTAVLEAQEDGFWIYRFTAETEDKGDGFA